MQLGRRKRFLVESAPKVFFVPPYVGPKGWVGINLGPKVRLSRVAELACEAYSRVAPKNLADIANPLKKIPTPDTLDVYKLDPLFFPNNQKLLEKLRCICLALPESTEVAAFGTPVFKAGKKTFCQFVAYKNIPSIYCWVGSEQQAFLTADDRYSVPACMGHNGWIQLKVDKRFDTKEVEMLVLESYKHFALKRMLANL